MKVRQPSQKDKAWRTLFLKYNILEKVKQEGKFHISIEQIRQYQESKIITKFDHQNNLPEVFKENSLGILPISREEYVISNFNTYQSIESEKESAEDLIRMTYLPFDLQSVKTAGVLGETAILHCAFASGMLADFLGEKELYPTVSGQMQTEPFSFQILNQKSKKEINLQVSHVPIEIDAAFESKESLTLVKIKKDLSQDFSIQQIYYPYRFWKEQVTKQIRLVFLVYSNSIFHFYEYKFQNPYQYHSLAIVCQRAYLMGDTNITQMDLNDLWNTIELCEESVVALPQAEQMERVINLCELLEAETMNRNWLTQQYDFDVKGAVNYTNAARYLGLVKLICPAGKKPIYALTDQGKRVMKLEYDQRQLEFCKCILRHEIFHELFGQALKFGSVPKQWLIVARMHKAGLYQVDNPKLYEQRAVTISGWIQWMLNLV